MKTLALRFSDAFAPKDGAIIKHQKILINMVMFGLENAVEKFHLRLYNYY